jgi:hypothetical protein
MLSDGKLSKIRLMLARRKLIKKMDLITHSFP